MDIEKQKKFELITKEDLSTYTKRTVKKIA
jgi:hypothetical protein